MKEKLLTVCLVIFLLISLKKDQVSSLNEKGVKAVVLEPESSDTEIKDSFKNKYKVRLFTKSVRCRSGYIYHVNTDRRFKAASWT